MEDFEKELKVGFLEEAEQSLVDVEQCFLSLEQNPTDSENLNKIFRLAHNLKGSSKAVGFDEMGAFTHEFETFILKVKNGEIPATANLVGLLLECNDFLCTMVQGLKADLSASFDGSALLERMRNFQEASAPAEVVEEPVEEVPAEVVGFDLPTPEPVVAAVAVPEAVSVETAVEIEPNLELLAELEGKFGVQAAESAPVMEAPPATVHPLPTKAEMKSEPKAEAKAETKPSSGNAPVVEDTLRVAVSKVENLLNAIGEMVILQSVLREQIASVSSPLIRKTVHQIGKLSKEIQDVSMGLRMVPVKPTFQKMQRIVRDTAKALNKDVGIVLSGEETEIDKTVLEKINDPLVHLIRNSVDHGIEKADLRKAAGKTEKGNVTLSAFHQSGKLVIEVRDDGGGLNAEKLKKKAVEKGLIAANANLSEKECFNLIFLPGFSTKEQVTDVSGRGVGMDVVRTNIRELNGEINIESVLGQGTVFRIFLPLTLAIIDGMVVSQAGQRFVIPLAHIHETLQAEESQLQQTSLLGEVLLLRGENLPLRRLGDFFGLKAENHAKDMIAIVIRTAQQPFALLVDDIIGQFQVVVKQLGPELQAYKGVSGSTILGDGKPALIVEPSDLHQRKLSTVPVTKKTKGLAS